MEAKLVGVFVGSAVGYLEIDVNMAGVGNFVEAVFEGVADGSVDGGDVSNTGFIEGADVVMGVFVGVVVVDDK